MELNFGSGYFERWRRYWRRRRYQRLNGDHCKKKLKIVRLGGGSARRIGKPRTTKKLHQKSVSPIKILATFHDAYVGMMIELAKKMGRWNNKGLVGGGKVAKDKNISVVCCGEQVIDSELVLEIYKRLEISGELREI